MFANMGSFSDAFGLDELNFGEFIGYFGIECSNTLGIGGALFAAILGISALSREERDKTSEFLLTQPLTRASIVTSKLLSVIVQIFIMNAVTLAVCMISAAAIGEVGNAFKMILIFTAHLILQFEIAALTFGISAFMRKGAFAVGIGIAFGLYFLNIISKLTDELEFLRYFTPFAYTDGGYIVKNSSLEFLLIAIGAVISALCIAAAYYKYSNKDIA
jgi:ABC-2 type transport system permease protein